MWKLLQPMGDCPACGERDSKRRNGQDCPRAGARGSQHHCPKHRAAPARVEDAAGATCKAPAQASELLH